MTDILNNIKELEEIEGELLFLKEKIQDLEERRIDILKELKKDYKERLNYIEKKIKEVEEVEEDLEEN